MKNVFFVLIAAVSLSCEHNSLVLDSRTTLELETTIIRDYQFLRNTYFFLDSTYREQYTKLNSERNHVLEPGTISPINSDAIEVYVASPRNDIDHIAESILGWAMLSGKVTSPQDTASVQSGIAEHGFFIRL
ncbi:MAG: hypothetical protein E2O79_04065, partial [Caldithrix sp.]